MQIRRSVDCRRWLLMLMLAGSAMPGGARAAIKETAWLCWMTTSNPPAIRCLPGAAHQPTPPTPENTAAADALELLRSRFYEGYNALQMERLYRLHDTPALASQTMAIPLFAIPYEDSWREQRPQQLLWMLLCQKISRCRITLRLPQ